MLGLPDCQTFIEGMVDMVVGSIPSKWLLFRLSFCQKGQRNGMQQEEGHWGTPVACAEGHGIDSGQRVRRKTHDAVQQVRADCVSH